MSLAKEMMGGGLSAGQATAINGVISPNITASGTTITDAFALNCGCNIVTSCGSGAGVKLMSAQAGDEVMVYNGQGSNALLIYPPSSSSTINQLSAGTPMSLAVWTVVRFKKISTGTWIAWLSA